MNIFIMDFEVFFEDAINKHFNELMIKKIVYSINGINIFETDEECFNRLKAEYWSFLKINGSDTVFAVFKSELEDAIKRAPNLPTELVIDFALSRFKEKQFDRRNIWVELQDWFRMSKEEITNMYIVIKAYDEALEILYKKLDPQSNTNFSNSEGNVSPLDTKKSNINRIKRAAKKNIYLKWVEDCDSLKNLYRELVSSGFLVERETDYKQFENHFLGKSKGKKIVWQKNLGSLIYLLDNLKDYIHKDAYLQSEKPVIKGLIGQHFVCVNIKDIKDTAIAQARSKFNSQGFNKTNKKNKEELDSILYLLRICLE